ncbi:MAG: adenylosuccinate lyase [Bacteroidetes bacterium]|nr:adenylosuccinate lyase [Bacteroidota bacterium]MCA0445313.1 adenylosuccinate lyase [Bacteroidota bacterium]
MIDRYTRKEMGAIWSTENKFRKWMEIEILACEARAEMGEIPVSAAKNIRERANFEADTVLEIENTVKHDVIAFLTNMNSYIGEDSRFVHQGMTSSDILDTGLSVQMAEAGKLLMQDLIRLRDILARRAKEFKFTLQIGRTHGIHAEPVTFGLKFALWFDETRRNIERLQHAIDTISVGKISGAVGTFEHLSPKVEEYVCEKLGLKPAPVSTQIIQRDRHAEFMSTLAVIASSLEKFATEIRHLQKTEVLEAEEFFSKGQKGSSAMPHKRNPIVCERIAGLARILRGNALAALENVSLWHERDISHSSVERVIIPDSTILLDYMLHLMNDVLDKLIVYPDNMQRNIDITHGLTFSQTLLIALTNKGLSREASYLMVQRNAMKTWETRRPFIDYVLEDGEIMQYFTKSEIETMFDLKKSIRNVDYIFQRVGLGD